MNASYEPAGCWYRPITFPPGSRKPRGDFRIVRADRLHYLSAVREDGVDGRRDAVDHDVDEQSRFSRRLPAGNPRPADFTGAIVERQVSMRIR
jgi:hypothetical protein